MNRNLLSDSMREHAREHEDARHANSRHSEAQAISGSLVLQHLPGSGDGKDSHVHGFAMGDEAIDEDESTDEPGTETKLADIQAWLNLECANQQARAASIDVEFGKYGARIDEETVAEPCPTVTVSDIHVLGRNQRGQWSREFAPHHLIASLRLEVPRQSHEESSSEILDVLLAWNRHVLGDCKKDLKAPVAISCVACGVRQCECCARDGAAVIY